MAEELEAHMYMAAGVPLEGFKQIFTPNEIGHTAVAYTPIHSLYSNSLGVFFYDELFKHLLHLPIARLSISVGGRYEIKMGDKPTLDTVTGDPRRVIVRNSPGNLITNIMVLCDRKMLKTRLADADHERFNVNPYAAEVVFGMLSYPRQELYGTVDICLVTDGLENGISHLKASLLHLALMSCPRVLIEGIPGYFTYKVEGENRILQHWVH